MSQRFTLGVMVLLLHAHFLLAVAHPAEAVKMVGPSTHTFTVSAGQTYRSAILLENPTSTDGVVRIYVRDYLFHADGQTRYGDPGSHSRSNASWISLGSDTVSVPAQSRRTVPYEVSVPGDRPLEGTYWSIIMVEPLPNQARSGDEERQAADEDAPGFSLVARIRYGLQVVTNVEATGRPDLALTGAQLLRSEDRQGRVFQVDIANRGSLWIRPRVLMELYHHESGDPVGVFDAPGRRIYPETSVRQRVELPDLEAGKYLGLLLIDGGGDHVYAARYTLEVPATPSSTED